MWGNHEILGFKVGSNLSGEGENLIFRAFSADGKKKVILKTPRSEVYSSLEKEKYHWEFQNLQKLSSLEGIVKVYQLTEWENRPVLVLEDFGETSLKKEIEKRGALPTEDFLWIGQQVCQILESLHQQRLIFKGLTSRKILLSAQEKRVKLSGLSTVSAIGEREDGGFPKRNRSYISPEQTGKFYRPLDHRSDLYSLGVVFYEILTGHLPFAEKDPLEFLHALLARKAHFPSSLPAQIPLPLQQITLKLLSKEPLHRYQSALGVMEDLKKCQIQWEKRNKIEDFPLGKKDIPTLFYLSPMLYGREREEELLEKNWQEVCRGNPRTLFIGGESGVGKSALVYHFQDKVWQKKGLFLSAKFDQFRSKEPYLALFQVFQDLFFHLLSQSKEKISYWREGIKQALGNNAGLLVEKFSPAEKLLGPLEIPPDLPPRERENRMLLTLQQFLSFCSSSAHPVVIFLDDLQWADRSTLKGIEGFITERPPHCFFIGAYRVNEISPTHPLASLLKSQECCLLSPLPGEAISKWLLDSFEKIKGGPRFSGRRPEAIRCFLGNFSKDYTRKRSCLLILSSRFGFWTPKGAEGFPAQKM